MNILKKDHSQRLQTSLEILIFFALQSFFLNFVSFFHVVLSDLHKKCLNLEVIVE